MPNITRSALDALSLTNFPNNTSQLISPADLRDWLDNGIDSFVTQKDKSRLENAIYENQGSGLAASATVDLASATGNYLHITGTFSGITSFGVIPAGGRFVLVFDDICTLTNSATLILPGGSDITTAAGDCAMLVSEGSGNWRMVGFFPISGGGGGGDITAVTAGTGLSGGGTSGAVTLNLANTAVTPDAYTNANITVDAQGRITAASNGTPGGVTSVTVNAPLADSGTPTAPNLSIPQANGTTDGFLDSSDWTTFNAKVSSTRSISTSSPLSGGGDLSADRTLSINQASGSQDGYLSQTDWTTFNNKQAAGNYITALTGDVTATGPGSVAASITNNAVTYGKLQAGSTNSLLLGTPSTGTAFQEITLGTGLTMTGGVLSSTGGGNPGGSNGDFQYKSGSSFAGTSLLKFSSSYVIADTPKIGSNTSTGFFHLHRNATVPTGINDHLTMWWDSTNKDVGFLFNQDGFESYFRFAATTSDKTYTFPDLSGTIALLANPASFSSLTSTSSVTIGTAGPTGTTGTIILQNATNANTLTLQSGTTSTSYTITLPPAASVGAQYLQTTGTGGTLQWTSGTTTGVSTVGAFSASAQTNGASISGSVITFGPASATVPGMVSTGTQIWDGNKTFQASAASAASVTINNGANSSVTNPQLLITSLASGSNIQWMSFDAGNSAVPTLTTARSAGTKIVLFRSWAAGSSLDYALGLGGNSLWLTSPQTISFYANSSIVSSGQFQYDNNCRGLNLNAASDTNFTIPQLLISSGSGSNSFISFGTGNSANPTLTTSRSVGTKIVLFNSWSTTSLDYALGVGSSSTFWLSSPGAITFYTNSSITVRATINTSGLTLGTGSALIIGANQVVGARRTGWTAQTATASRADLGANPTTAQLASFCRALYDDLASAAGHGLIN